MQYLANCMMQDEVLRSLQSVAGGQVVITVSFFDWEMMPRDAMSGRIVAVYPAQGYAVLQNGSGLPDRITLAEISRVSIG